MQRGLWAVAILLSVVLGACGGSSDSEHDLRSSAPATDSMRTKHEREKREKEIQSKFVEATAAIERTKASLASVSKRGDPDLLRILSESQAAIQEVAQTQKHLDVLFGVTSDMFEEVEKENLKLTKEKKFLEARKVDLESREKLFSMGFYTSLGAVVIAFAALLSKLPTVFLDRRFRKLELLQKRIEIRKLRRELSLKATRTLSTSRRVGNSR